MKLWYRGVSYAPNPTSKVETIQGEVGGKYRGLPWRHIYIKISGRLSQPSYELYYRGVTPLREKENQLNGVPTPAPNSFSSL